MKRIVMTIGVAVVAFTTVAAQESTVLTNKEGKPILPTAGNYAIGLDAAPFLNYAGGLFSNTGTIAPRLAFPGGLTLSGKYFLSDKTALRTKLLVDYGSKTDVTLDDKAGVTPPTDGSQIEQVEDKTRTSSLSIGVSAGLEKRFGDTRWQFFYGADASLGIGFIDNKHYTYGNDLSADNPVSRPLKETNGTTFSIGANVFGGVEYFVAPRVSIGGELGWGISYSRTGTGTEELEAWESNAVKKSEAEVAGNRGASFNLRNVNGNINVIFYF